MAKTSIEWTDYTWNPITGCDIESPGCIHCYAMTLAGTRLRNHPSRIGLTKQAGNGAHVWTGEVRFNEQWLEQPLRWRAPRMVFVVAHGDLFHPKVPDAWIDKVFAVMARSREHTFQVLTKRAKRMREYMTDPETCGRILVAAYDIPTCAMEAMPWPLPNVWAGISAEDQKRADERVAELIQTPAAIRWISAEPLLEEIDFHLLQLSPRIDWVVGGAESGNRARPTNVKWARSLRDQCVGSGTAFLWKQWGCWLPADQPESRRFSYDDERCEHQWDDSPTSYSIRLHKKDTGRVLDGRLWDEYPTIENTK